MDRFKAPDIDKTAEVDSDMPRGDTGEGGEAGRHDTGHQGESQRPTGTSTARDMTGVDPQEPIDGGSPNG